MLLFLFVVLLKRKAIVKDIIYVIPYTKTIVLTSFAIILAPAIVEDIMAGNLAIAVITINLLNEIGNKLPMYVRKSFGTNGKKYNRNRVFSYLSGFSFILFSTFSNFCFETTSSTKSLPYLFTAL